MEASALLSGLQLAEKFGTNFLVVESDSLEVVQAVLDPSEFRGSFALVIDDCRHLLRCLAWQRCNMFREKLMHSLMSLLATVLRRVFGVFGSLIP
jgi:ribonuclease HI